MILSLFTAVKSIQVISGFNSKRMKKIARWRCNTKISKTNLKIIETPPGVSKNWEDQTEDHFGEFDA